MHTLRLRGSQVSQKNPKESHGIPNNPKVFGKKPQMYLENPKESQKDLRVSKEFQKNPQKIKKNSSGCQRFPIILLQDFVMLTRLNDGQSIELLVMINVNRLSFDVLYFIWDLG